MKRYLYLWHRWLGIALCLFLALWFISGMVMLFVGYPKLTPEEHLGRLAPLPEKGCCVAIETVLHASGTGEIPQSLRLSGIADAPRYLLGYRDGRVLAVDALSGQPIGNVGAAEALASARQFGAGATAHYQHQVEEDTWTHSRSLDSHRPLHVLQLDDPARRRLYVSSHTGAVVLDVTADERTWNWLGAWLHWLYPLRGGLLDGWWANIVIYLSLAATFMAVLGLWVGLLRWRFSRPYRSGSRSPYAGGFARWHHIGGLLFGVLLIAWIFSGLMSMRPWQLLGSASQLSTDAYRGGELEPRHFPITVAEALARFRQAGLQPRELEWRMLDGQGYLVAYDGSRNSRILPMTEGAEALQSLPATLLLHAARRLSAQSPFTSEWLEHYDFYYYQRAEQSMYGYQNNRLPMLRVRFADAPRSWVHIDPYSGALIEQLDGNRRTARILFNLLHSWDWLPLLEHPRLREALILAFSLGGLVISLSGVVLGWRRLRRRRPAHRPEFDRKTRSATARR